MPITEIARLTQDGVNKLETNQQTCKLPAWNVEVMQQQAV
jgi:hypothetical protein